MKKQDIPSQLLHLIPDASIGLGDEIFLSISRLTPIVNVDLLIQRSFNGKKYTLLTWRSDNFYLGWHLPGGILRFKERISTRIGKVAESELESKVTKAQGPIAINEIISSERDARGHFISLLYSVDLVSYPDFREGIYEESPVAGAVNWFQGPPLNLLKQHDIYVRYF
jgi:colanic acid biosynthesis protein WcaH